MERHAGCDDACHDLAALQEGTLSPDGIRRLARHVVQCDTCKIMVAFMMIEALQRKRQAQ
jgi:hypothetical protein